MCCVSKSSLLPLALQAEPQKEVAAEAEEEAPLEKARLRPEKSGTGLLFQALSKRIDGPV